MEVVMNLSNSILKKVMELGSVQLREMIIEHIDSIRRGEKLTLGSNRNKKQISQGSIHDILQDIRSGKSNSLEQLAQAVFLHS